MSYYVRYIGHCSVQARRGDGEKISHPDKHWGSIEPGEILLVEGPRPPSSYEELTKRQVDEILTGQIVADVDGQDEGEEEGEAPVPGSGILPSPDSFVDRRKAEKLSFFAARSEIKELTDGAVKGKTYDGLLENYAAWHMAVGQGFDG